MTTYRVGNHNPLKVYRDAEDIGVMYTAEDAGLVVEALNGVDELRAIVAKAEDEQCGCLGGPLTIEWAAPVADSCTGCTAAKGNPDCPVHQGRKPRGPKPPPLGPGCICDGSGRTCPRHGAVI